MLRMQKSLIFSVLIFLALSNDSCKIDNESSDDCNHESSEPTKKESLMLKATRKDEEQPSKNITIGDLEDDIEEVDGDYEPCIKKEADGQLQRSLITAGGYTIER